MCTLLSPPSVSPLRQPMDAHTLLSLIGWAVELSPAVLLVKVLLRDESRERYVWVVVLHPESRATVGVRVFGVRAVSCGVVTWMYHHPHMCAARGDDSLALAAPRHTAARRGHHLFWPSLFY